MHLQENGFNVVVEDMPNSELAEIKTRYGIAPQYRSCHTAEVDGYFVEGHVPADVIQQMLTEAPDIDGLVLPGMPIGSPGMDGPQQGPLEILAFTGTAGVTLYAQR